jgi:hypothetical protein
LHLLLASAWVLVAIAAAATPTASSKQAKGSIEGIAMDGARVVYDVQGDLPRRCNRVFVWNAVSDVTTRVSGKGTCDADNTTTSGVAVRLAIAGTRVAWIVEQGSNSEVDDSLYAAGLGGPKERRLAYTRRTGSMLDPSLVGGWIGGLVGHGGLLAVNRWTTSKSGAIVDARLELVGPKGLSLAVSGPASVEAQAADSGRIAVLRPDDTVAVYAAGGELLRTIAPAAPHEVALAGRYLAVLTGKGRLEIYNARSGIRLRSWRVPAGAAHLDISGPTAAYTIPGEVRALRLTTGKDAVIARTRGQANVQIEPAGLVYSVRSRLTFVPLARVLAQLS